MIWIVFVSSPIFFEYVAHCQDISRIRSRPSRRSCCKGISQRCLRTPSHVLRLFTSSTGPALDHRHIVTPGPPACVSRTLHYHLFLSNTSMAGRFVTSSNVFHAPNAMPCESYLNRSIASKARNRKVRVSYAAARFHLFLIVRCCSIQCLRSTESPNSVHASRHANELPAAYA